eukprot:3818140-Rhodomonas_salina.1
MGFASNFRLFRFVVAFRSTAQQKHVGNPTALFSTAIVVLLLPVLPHYKANGWVEPFRPISIPRTCCRQQTGAVVGGERERRKERQRERVQWDIRTRIC